MSIAGTSQLDTADFVISLSGVCMFTSPFGLMALGQVAALSLRFTGVSLDPRGLTLLDVTTKLFFVFEGVLTPEEGVTRLLRRREGVPCLGMSADDFLGVTHAWFFDNPVAFVFSPAGF